MGNAGIVLLSQDTTTIEILSRSPWYVLVFFALGGSGIIAAAIAKVWAYTTNYLTTKQAHAMKVAEEERAHREKRQRAELEQHEALADMARSMPRQFEQLAAAQREANALMRAEIAENTRTVKSLVALWQDESRQLIAAMAHKVGVQTNDAVVNRPSTAGQ